MEANSLEAIESLVHHGLGSASIVPKRACAPPFANDLRVVPFGTPQEVRALAMVERSSNPRARLADALLHQLRCLAEGDSAPSSEDPPVTPSAIDGSNRGLPDAALDRVSAPQDLDSHHQ